MRTARSVVAAVCLATGAAAVWAQQTVPPFRLGVDAIPLDVLVLDKRQQPVHGLTRADFTILEDGQPQSIVSFDEIRLADPPAPTAPWMLEAGSDVVSNSEPFRRLVMIVMDDGNTGVNFGEPRSVRKIANAVIDQLGPDDMAAVIYTYFGRHQNFTRDRQKLRAAIEAFEPHNWGRAGLPLPCVPSIGIRVGGCAVNTLKTIGEFLRTAPPGRKTLIYVSPGVNFAFSPFDPTVSTQIFALQDMLQALQLSNVSVYAVDPTGVQMRPRDPNVLDFADNTGGRSVRNDNEAWLEIPSIFHENSSYYLMGYQSTHLNPDGRFRKIEVKVNRPDTVVRNRTGYYARKPEKTKTAKEPPSAVDRAMSSGLPGGTIPLRLNAAPFAAPGRREADVALVIGVGESVTLSGASRRVNVVATAFDKDWKPKGAFAQTVELAPGVAGAGSVSELFAHLPLRPGRYEIRVVAEEANGTGNVYVDVDVPDFGSEALSASGLVLQRAGVPTTVRDFGPTERIAACLSVYQHAGREEVSPTVVARIVDDANHTVASETTKVSPTGGAPRSADYRFELPLSTLRPGQHLLTLEITAGSRTIRREVRFTVRR